MIEEQMRIDRELWNEAMDYTSYRSTITERLQRGLVTGKEQSELYLQYTSLNEHRMNRWDKHFVPDEQMTAAMSKIEAPRVWLIITEGWCGDSAQNLPAIEKIARLNSLIKTKYLFRDDHDEAMQLLLTNGSRSIPVLACLDQEGNLLWKWGPYPTGAKELIQAAKSAGISKDKWKEDLHLWYARNKQADLQQDLISLIASENPT